MKLALETATNICSVALEEDGGDIFEKRSEARGTHSEQLFIFIDEVKTEHRFEVSQLDSIVVSEGPGSYTGLRISASAVKGLLFGTDVPLFAANTLASYALAAAETLQGPATIHSVIDARRVHLYHQKFIFETGRLSPAGEVKVTPIEDLEKRVSPGDAIVGTGLNRIDREVLSEVKMFDHSYISATSLIRLVNLTEDTKLIRRVDPEQFDPNYHTTNQP